MALQLSFKVEDKCTTIRLMGSLSGSGSPLDSVVVNPNFDLNLDLRELNAVNSLGIRNFHNWISTVQCQRMRLLFCPYVFINQVNMVKGFLPAKAEIESFFVPYFSDGTGEEKMVLLTKLLDYNKIDGKIVVNPPELFDSLGVKMEMDIFPDQYFKFLDIYY